MLDLIAGPYASSRHIRHSIPEVGERQAAVQSPEAREQLRLVHQRALEAAVARGCRSIAFPAISTGVYRFPKRAAAAIAIAVMRAHAPKFERVVACLFDAESERYYREQLEREGGNADLANG